MICFNSSRNVHTFRTDFFGVMPARSVFEVAEISAGDTSVINNPALVGIQKHLDWQGAQEIMMAGGQMKSVFEVLFPPEFSPEDWERAHGKTFIDTTSNDYFSTQNIKPALDIKCKSIRAGQKLSSPVFQNGLSELKTILKNMLGSERVFFANSGYAANIAALTQLVSPDTPVYYDPRAHESCQAAIHGAKGWGLDHRLAKEVREVRRLHEEAGHEIEEDVRSRVSGLLERLEILTSIYRFKHNDPNDLEKKVLAGGPGVLIVDGMYSVEGDLVNPEVVRVAKKLGCLVLVDESHSMLGTSTQKMTVNEQLGLNADIITASTSKAGAAHGGVISVQPPLVQRYLEFKEGKEGRRLSNDERSSYAKLFTRYFQRANRLVFSNAADRGEMLAFKARIEFLYKHPDRSEKLRTVSAKVREDLKKAGINLASESPMMFLVCGDHDASTRVRDHLRDEHGVLGSLYISPATKPDGTGVRLCLNYDICSDDNLVQRFVSAIIDASQKFNLADLN